MAEKQYVTIATIVILKVMLYLSNGKHQMELAKRL